MNKVKHYFSGETEQEGEREGEEKDGGKDSTEEEGLSSQTWFIQVVIIQSLFLYFAQF